MKKVCKTKHGDTIMEVCVAIAIFAMVSIVSMQAMNGSYNQAQRALEITMARNEMDIQAEALRFIHNSFVAEREYVDAAKQYHYLWRLIAGKDSDLLTEPENIDDEGAGANAGFNVNSYDNCEAYYNTVKDPANKIGNFVLNPRFLQSESVAEGHTPKDRLNYYKTYLRDEVLITDPDKLNVTYTYPRITYTRLPNSGSTLDDVPDVSNTEHLSETGHAGRLFRGVQSAEGILVTPVKGRANDSVSTSDKPEFYDFYIRTCWQGVGSKAPSTLSTIVRLYNPEMID